jgi:serine/threonine-protein kinase RsbW
MPAKQGVGAPLVDVVALHHHALRPLDQGSALRSGLEVADLPAEVAQLRETALRKIDRALQRVGGRTAGVGVQPMVERGPHEPGIIVFEQQHDRAGRGVVELLDEPQSVHCARMDRHNGKLGARLRDRLADAGQLSFPCRHPVPSRGDQLGSALQRLGLLIGDDGGQGARLVRSGTHASMMAGVWCAPRCAVRRRRTMSPFGSPAACGRFYVRYRPTPERRPSVAWRCQIGDPEDMGTRKDGTGAHAEATPQAGGLDLTVPAVANRIGELRQAARAFAELHGVERPADVALAITEACANVATHAYRDRDPGPLRLTGAREDTGISFVVADQGSGLAPRPDSPGLGMGLPLIAQLADHFEVSDNDGAGTRVRMRFAFDPTAPPRRSGTGDASRLDASERR